MTAAAGLSVRVTVSDAWDTVRLDARPDETIHDIKTRALGATLGRADVDLHQVKFRGAVVLDESRSLADLGVPNGAALIVLAARRRPVR